MNQCQNLINGGILIKIRFLLKNQKKFSSPSGSISFTPHNGSLYTGTTQEAFAFRRPCYLFDRNEQELLVLFLLYFQRLTAQRMNLKTDAAELTHM
ncbi:hypothetical protein BT93_B0130 [Corymbia citriodora subsp. variegata]|nr:hypothetical protein BT93_B0130 [Corymbia citriodora subsp. variegata]